MTGTFATGDAHVLRQRLDDIGYTATGVREAVGDYALAALRREEPWAAAWACRTDTDLHAVFRLFTLARPLPLDVAARALGPLERWRAAGVITLAGNTVHPAVHVRPFSPAPDTSWLIASDIIGPGLAADAVMGVGGSSQTLANMTVRDPVGRTLDLGTGGGIQSLYAAQHSDRVLATDRNPRALAFAALNLALNAVANVTLAEGDLFEPAPDHYGLVVSNPPFVISPESTYLFRDGGLEGDGLCRRLVREAPAHLQNGGYCQLLANWAITADGDWRSQLGAWFDGTACDVWVLQRELQSPADYASTWLAQGDSSQRADRYNDWMRWYDTAGIEAMGFGVITLRLPLAGAPRHQVLQEISQDIDVRAGEYVTGQFDRLDFLADTNDEVLAMSRLSLAEHVLLEQSSAREGDSWEPTQLRVRQVRGLRWSGDIHPAGAMMLAGCDGNRPLVDVLAGAGVSITDLPGALVAIRQLIAQGFLLP